MLTEWLHLPAARRPPAADYDELAHTIGKSEAACRQMVSRAKAQLREARPRYTVAPEAHLRVMRQFADALARGDFSSMKAMPN